MILLWLACSEAPSRAEQLASAAAHGTLADCAALETDLRDTCELGLVEHTRPGEWSALCPALRPGGPAVDECWFRLAERAIVAGSTDEGLRLCVASGRFARDCARHLWQQTFRSDAEAGRALLPRIREALPEHADAFSPDNPNIREQEWKFRLRDTDDLATVDCSADVLCAKALYDAVADRWQAAAAGPDGPHWCALFKAGEAIDPADPLLGVRLGAPAAMEPARQEGLRQGCAGRRGASGRRGRRRAGP